MNQVKVDDQISKTKNKQGSKCKDVLKIALITTSILLITAIVGYIHYKAKQ